MKNFLQNVFSQTGIKVFVYGMLPLAAIFSIFWSFQDKAINIWPLIYWTIAMIVIVILHYLLRNNP